MEDSKSKSRAHDDKSSTAHRKTSSLHGGRRKSPVNSAKPNVRKGFIQSKNRLQDEDDLLDLSQVLPDSRDTYDSVQEIDPFGELKITPSGELTGDRRFVCPVFRLVFRLDPYSRDVEFYMMASDCASAIANAIPDRPPKLIRWWEANVSYFTSAKESPNIDGDKHQHGIIKARTAFRAFGHLVVRDGRPIHDDYFELDSRDHEWKNRSASQYDESEQFWIRHLGETFTKRDIQNVVILFRLSMKRPLRDVPKLLWGWLVKMGTQPHAKTELSDVILSSWRTLKDGSVLMAMFEVAWDLLSSTDMEEQHENTFSVPGRYSLGSDLSHTSLCYFEWCIPSVVLSLGPYQSVRDVLADLVILSGNSDAFEASTCFATMVAQWDTAGSQAFSLICEVVEHLLGMLKIGDTCFVADVADLNLVDKIVTGNIGASCSAVAMETTPNMKRVYRIAFVQAIGWMCAAIRDGAPQNEGIERKEDAVCVYGVLGKTFSNPYPFTPYRSMVTVDFFKPRLLLPSSPDKEFSCWKHLFRQVTVVDKAIKRTWGRGLQLSFDLMIELTAAESFVSFDGGTLLLGYFTALVPIEMDTTGTCIQWHLESLDEAAGELMSLQMLRELVMYDWLKTTPENLQGKTCFLGWTSNANILLGTKQLVERGTPVTWTRGLKVQARGTESDGFEVGGQLSLPIPAISPVLKASKSYKFVRYTTQRHPLNDYRSALDCLQSKVSLLIDSESKQAWLVPMLSLVLHLCHVYFLANNTLNQPNPIPFAQPSSNGYEAAKNAIADCGSLTVFGCETDEDRLLLRTLLFRILLNLNDHPRNTMSKWRRETHLMANELMDAVMHQDSSPKMVPIVENSHSWPDLLPFAEVADSVGVCANVGPAIVPQPQMSPCLCQTELPKMRGYLAVHVRSFGKLCLRGGYNLDDIKNGRCHITPLMCWTLRSDPWTQVHCRHGCLWNSKEQYGKILQKTQSKWKRGDPLPSQAVSKIIPDDGAVVFGRENLKKSFLSTIGLEI